MKYSLGIILYIGWITFLAGCSTTPISEEGKNVMMVVPLSATEVGNYLELGQVLCSESIAISNVDESCRNTLRNEAAALGADIIVIESRDSKKCLDDRDGCIKMTARAYRKKTKATS